MEAVLRKERAKDTTAFTIVTGSGSDRLLDSTRVGTVRLRLPVPVSCR